MPGIGLLHRIDRKRANCVNAKAIKRRASAGQAPARVNMRVNTRNYIGGHLRLTDLEVRNPQSSEDANKPSMLTSQPTLGSNKTQASFK
jgi:hypothetical protein